MEYSFKYMDLLFWVVLALNYLTISLSMFCLMKRRHLNLKFLAFVPIVNSTYCLGSISDSINSNYFNKTKSRFLLVMLNIICLCSLLILVQTCSMKLPEFKYSVLDVFIGNVTFEDAITIISREMERKSVVFYVLCFTSATILIYLIYLFKTYYNIYSEYGGSASKLMLTCAIFSGAFLTQSDFLANIFIFLIRNKASKFENLNRTKNFV